MCALLRTHKLYVSEYRDTLRLAIPLVIGQVGQIVLAFADSLMVGNYGVRELAAASFCINLFNLPIIFLMGYSYGVLPALGRSFQSLHATQQIVLAALQNVFWVSLGICALMTLPLFFLNAFQQPQDLIPLIIAYYLPTLVSLPLLGFFNILKQFFDSRGNTWIAMGVLLASNALNILGNYLLIFGKFGFPELGLLGAALSTLLARLLATLALLYLYIRYRYQTRIQRLREQIRKLAFPRLAPYELFRNGMGMGIQMGLETALFSISVIFVGWMGEISLAAHHIAITIQTIGFMTYYGLGGAVALRVSGFLGRRQLKRSYVATTTGRHLLLFTACCLAVLLGIFRNQIPELFTDNPQVVALASLLLLIGIAYQPADALQVCYSNALRGIGDASGLTLTSFLAYFVVALPLCYGLSRFTQLGAIGIWIAYPVGLLLAGIFYALRFYARMHILKNTPHTT